MVFAVYYWEYGTKHYVCICRSYPYADEISKALDKSEHWRKHKVEPCDSFDGAKELLQCIFR